MQELARLPKLHPRTKHTNICYHDYHEHVHKGLIKIFLVGTSNQVADAFAKVLAQNNFLHYHVHLCAK
jgi:hypothetical protein